MRRLNSMEFKLSLFTPTKLFLVVILLNGTLVEPRLKTGFDSLLQAKTSKNSNPNLRSAQSTESVTFDANTMKELVCGSYWFKNLFDRNLPQSILPLSNKDTDNLVWDVVNVFGGKFFVSEENFHTETTNETIKWLLDAHRFWTELTEYTPDHELYDEIWNSFMWRDAKKGFATSKDALNFITQLHLVLQSTRQDAELTMLMDFFDQPLYFDNNPRLKSFPPSKTGDTFLSNFKLPAQIRSLMPRDMSVVKAIEEAQNMISFNRKELKYSLRVLNVKTLNLRLITRRCQSYIAKITVADKKVVCGKPLPSARIAGGKVANQGSWPWMVYIRCSSKDSAWYYVSAGVLISDTHVLTSTHCAFTLKPENLEVYIGEFDLDEFGYSSTLCEVEKIFTHEDYNKQGNNEHDIALIKLKEKVIFNNDRHPICLPPPNITLDGKTAYMAGWGKANEDDDNGSRKLLEGASSIWEQAKCVKNYGYEEVTEQQLCIGGVGGVDPCRFDGGGPVMHQTASGQWMVVGLVSWVYGFGCARLGFPSVSTRVSTYLDWINAKLLL